MTERRKAWKPKAPAFKNRTLVRYAQNPGWHPTARSPRPTRMRRFAAMRISSGAALAAVLIAGRAAQADELSDGVPGHPGVTYGALLKQVMPGMQKNADGGWDSGP